MKMLVLGAGATGGYFGGRMVANGGDVTFLVREKRAAELERDGLVIKSPVGDWRGRVQTITAKDLGPGYDAVLFSAKAFALPAAIEAIRPAVAGDTLVLPLLNGLNHLAVLDAAFGTKRVLGGLCSISVTLDEEGSIRHLNDMQLFTYGARSPGQIDGARRLLPELQRGGFAPVLADNVMQDMWEKFVFLTSLAGMTCLMRASVGTIQGTRDGDVLMRALVAECASVASASGYAPRARHLEMAHKVLCDAASQLKASMLRDIERGQRTEADHIVGDMLARARGFGIAAPVLTAAYAHLQCYEATRADG